MPKIPNYDGEYSCTLGWVMEYKGSKVGMLTESFHGHKGDPSNYYIRLDSHYYSHPDNDTLILVNHIAELANAFDIS